MISFQLAFRILHFFTFHPTVDPPPRAPGVSQEDEQWSRRRNQGGFGLLHLPHFSRTSWGQLRWFDDWPTQVVCVAFVKKRWFKRNGKGSAQDSRFWDLGQVYDYEFWWVKPLCKNHTWFTGTCMVSNLPSSVHLTFQNKKKHREPVLVWNVLVIQPVSPRPCVLWMMPLRLAWNLRVGELWLRGFFSRFFPMSHRGFAKGYLVGDKWFFIFFTGTHLRRIFTLSCSHSVWKVAS